MRNARKSTEDRVELGKIFRDILVRSMGDDKRNFYGAPVADRYDGLCCHCVLVSLIILSGVPERSSNPFRPTTVPSSIMSRGSRARFSFWTNALSPCQERWGASEELLAEKSQIRLDTHRGDKSGRLSLVKHRGPEIGNAGENPP
jgi:hypothetical protein